MDQTRHFQVRSEQKSVHVHHLFVPATRLKGLQESGVSWGQGRGSWNRRFLQLSDFKSLDGASIHKLWALGSTPPLPLVILPVLYGLVDTSSTTWAFTDRLSVKALGSTELLPFTIQNHMGL